MNDYDLHHERMRNALTEIKQAELRTRQSLITGDDRMKVEAARDFAAEVRAALATLGDV